MTIVNTAVETSLLSGTLFTFAANSIKKGTSIRARIFGNYSTKAAPVGTLTFFINLGTGGHVGSIGAFTPSASLSNEAFFIDWFVLWVGAGASVTGYSGGKADMFSALSTETAVRGTGQVTWDLTQAYALDLTAQWGTADPGNSISCFGAVIQVDEIVS